jgi:uncharacterized protein YecE (DUF72 family)
MEFGRVPQDLLNTIDFSLPKEPAFNKQVLGGEKRKLPAVYIGCAKWGRKEWLGKIYPKGLKEADFLKEYVKHYNSIELNATHYKIYDAKAIAKWGANATGKQFKFCPKFPQSISHYSNFLNAQESTTAFLEGILAFKENLGPIFLQVSEKYSPGRKENLFKYLASLPTDLQFFLEVRHPDWFADSVLKKELFDTLCHLKIGAVITDTAARRDCAHMYLTLPKTFIRYVGNSLHPTDYTRIDEWVKRIKHWLDNGLEELYFFMHMHDEALSPDLTIYLTEKMNKKCGLQLKIPTLVQPTLF